jgi:hypothetical protein
VKICENVAFKTAVLHVSLQGYPNLIIKKLHHITLCKGVDMFYKNSVKL